MNPTLSMNFKNRLIHAQEVMKEKNVIRKIFNHPSSKLEKLIDANSEIKMTPKVGIANMKANFEDTLRE